MLVLTGYRHTDSCDIVFSCSHGREDVGYSVHCVPWISLIHTCNLCKSLVMKKVKLIVTLSVLSLSAPERIAKDSKRFLMHWWTETDAFQVQKTNPPLWFQWKATKRPISLGKQTDRHSSHHHTTLHSVKLVGFSWASDTMKILKAGQHISLQRLGLSNSYNRNPLGKRFPSKQRPTTVSEY